MNPAQLSALFAKHKTAVLGTAAAGVAGVALLHRKNAGAAAPAATSAPAGTIPAAAVVPGGGSYDSSAYDVYSALQSQLSPLLEQARNATGGTTGGGVTTAPAPIASTLFKPSFSGNYVRRADGLIAEVEADGSLYALTKTQWADVNRQAPGAGKQVTNLGASLPASVYSLARNIKSAAANSTSTKSGS